MYEKRKARTGKIETHEKNTDLSKLYADTEKDFVASYKRAYTMRRSLLPVCQQS